MKKSKEKNNKDSLYTGGNKIHYLYLFPEVIKKLKSGKFVDIEDTFTENYGEEMCAPNFFLGFSLLSYPQSTLILYVSKIKLLKVKRNGDKVIRITVKLAKDQDVFVSYCPNIPKRESVCIMRRNKKGIIKRIAKKAIIDGLDGFTIYTKEELSCRKRVAKKSISTETFPFTFVDVAKAFDEQYKITNALIKYADIR